MRFTFPDLANSLHCDGWVKAKGLGGGGNHWEYSKYLNNVVVFQAPEGATRSEDVMTASDSGPRYREAGATQGSALPRKVRYAAH